MGLGEMSGLSLITRDTVCVDAPATEATFSRVVCPVLLYIVIDPVIDNGIDNILTNH